MGKVHIGFVVDESGSMAGRQQAVVQGFNQFVGELRGADGDPTEATLAFFDSCGSEPKVRTIFDGLPLDEVPELADGQYNPRGGTPLNDAISEVVGKVAGRMGEEDRAMLVIMTDGQENSSELSTEKLRQLVSQKEKDGWEFIYLGANVDAFSEATNIGLSKAGSFAGWSGTAQGAVHSHQIAGKRAAAYRHSPATYMATSSAMASTVSDDAHTHSINLAQLDDAIEQAKAAAGSGS